MSHRHDRSIAALAGVWNNSGGRADGGPIAEGHRFSNRGHAGMAKAGSSRRQKRAAISMVNPMKDFSWRCLCTIQLCPPPQVVTLNQSEPLALRVSAWALANSLTPLEPGPGYALQVVAKYGGNATSDTYIKPFPTGTDCCPCAICGLRSTIFNCADSGAVAG